MGAGSGRRRGFTHTATLLKDRIRKAGEARGFAVTRLLTHWPEIAGADIAAIARPVEITYGRQGFGATLTLLTTGANAPMLDMQKETLRERVNSAYGHRAISRIRITQTAPTGFAEGAVEFTAKPRAASDAVPDGETLAAARSATRDVADTGLRDALEALATNVLSKSKR